MGTVRVNVDNFARAETDHMLASIAKGAGGTGQWLHFRQPTPLDAQPVIRQNRDTLYSALVANISAGASLSVPDVGDRYLSLMVVNQDHYVNRVFHKPGVYELTMEEFDTPFVLLAARILLDPADPDDAAVVNGLQDQLGFTGAAADPFVMPDYDQESYQSTRNALLELGRGLGDLVRAFGKKDDVDPIHHLIATASGWGGLPDQEARYIMVDPGLPLGEYKIEIGEVPVDAFWSISLYNRDGYFEQNERNLYSINSITAERNPDGTITVNFGVSDEPKPNYFPIMDGWNYAVRLYRPRPEVLDGSWTFPELQPA